MNTEGCPPLAGPSWQQQGVLDEWARLDTEFKSLIATHVARAEAELVELKAHTPAALEAIAKFKGSYRSGLPSDPPELREALTLGQQMAGKGLSITENRGRFINDEWLPRARHFPIKVLRRFAMSAVVTGEIVSCPLDGSQYLKNLPGVLVEHAQRLDALAKRFKGYQHVPAGTPPRGPLPSPVISDFDPRCT